MENLLTLFFLLLALVYLFETARYLKQIRNTLREIRDQAPRRSPLDMPAPKPARR